MTYSTVAYLVNLAEADAKRKEEALSDIMKEYEAMKANYSNPERPFFGLTDDMLVADELNKMSKKCQDAQYNYQVAKGHLDELMHAEVVLK